MKKYFIVITYTSVILGMFALFSALTQEYPQNQHDFNVQRLINEGIRLQAVVIDKKEVKTEYKGTYSMPKESIENRVYIKIIEPPHQGKIVWQKAHPKVYENIIIGAKVHAYIKRDDVFIEELKYVEESRTRRFLLAAFGLFCLAALANMKANKYPRYLEK